MVYICDKCHFAFERAGAVENCVDCGKQGIREATDAETAEYRRNRAEISAMEQKSKMECQSGEEPVCLKDLDVC